MYVLGPPCKAYHCMSLDCGPLCACEGHLGRGAYIQAFALAPDKHGPNGKVAVDTTPCCLSFRKPLPCTDLAPYPLAIPRTPSVSESVFWGHGELN